MGIKWVVFEVVLKTRTGMFYQDLQTRAEVEIFKFDNTRTTGYRTSATSSPGSSFVWRATCDEDPGEIH